MEEKYRIPNVNEVRCNPKNASKNVKRLVPSINHENYALKLNLRTRNLKLLKIYVYDVVSV